MLTQNGLAKIKAGERDRMEPDGDGLYLLVRASGRKTWLVRYWQDGRERKLTIGDFPAVTLSQARQKRDEIKSRVRSGLPARDEPDKMQLANVAREWLKYKSPQWVFKYTQTVTYRVEHYILPALGNTAIGALTRQQVTAFLLSLSRRGTVVTARRVGEVIMAIADYALERGYITSHPLQNVTRILPQHTPEHFEHAQTPETFGALLAAIDQIKQPITRAALQVTALCFVRVGELLAATWAEIDFKNALWTIPAGHTKRRRELTVPLARQTIKILRGLKEFEQREIFHREDIEKEFVFPARHPRIYARAAITEAAMLKALKVLCWEASKEGRTIPASTVHGFRHAASTLLYSMGENTLHIEKQLAHLDPHRIRAVYNAYDFLDERRAMMQRYANKLDMLKQPFTTCTALL